MVVTTRAAQAAAPARSWSYVVWWVGLLLLHVVNALFYLGFASFYKHLRGKNLAFQLKTYSIGIAQSEYEGVAKTHAVVFAIHVLYIALMVNSSIAARRFIFFPSVTLAQIVDRATSCVRQRIQPLQAPRTTHHQISRLASVPQMIMGSASRSVDLVFGRRGLLGVDGVYFDDLLVIRELFETTLQSYQAYRMTRLLPRLGLIRVYVALLVANCWSVPILHRVYRNQHTKRRIVSLLCDAVLDTVSSLGITLLIFVTYAPQYTDQRFGFPFTNWFNDQWFTSVHQEFQMMLVVSWVDMASRLVFALGLLQCMDAVKDMLEQVPAKSNVDPSADGKNAIVPTPAPGPEIALVRASQAQLQVPRFSRLQRLKQLVLHTIAPCMFVVWGFAILGVHSYAEYVGTNWPCKLELRPWFNAEPACSLVEIDCYAHGASGSEASLDSAWMLFDPSFTAHLTIRHCPELVISPAITAFRDLTSLKIYNSTIINWSEVAAITSTNHAALRALYFVHTTFANATLPPGLMTSQFPQTLRSFVVSSSNLGSLPADLHRVWPQRMTLAFEYSQFTSIPDVVMRMKPSLVSFSQNAITSVPASLFEIPTLANLLLCFTPIQELPQNVTSPSTKLYVFLIEGTNISTLWSWLDPIIARSLTFTNKRYFNLRDTPFCKERAEIESGTRTNFSASETVSKSALASVMDVSTPSRLAYSQAGVACGLDMVSFFPLALEDAVSAMIK